ncbi:MAG: hypothetical protein DMG11_19015 [Acidobacteria bacterium]|nr:MAG: hypothetical protein DMG11_19015 [Acidobacteriota bacterium]
MSTNIIGADNHPLVLSAFELFLANLQIRSDFRRAESNPAVSWVGNSFTKVMLFSLAFPL